MLNIISISIDEKLIVERECKIQQHKLLLSVCKDMTTKIKGGWRATSFRQRPHSNLDSRNVNNAASILLEENGILHLIRFFLYFLFR